MIGEGSNGGFLDSDFQTYPDMIQFGAFDFDRRNTLWIQTLQSEGYFSKWNTGSGGPSKTAPVKIGVITYNLPEWVSSTKGALVSAIEAAGYASPSVEIVAPHDDTSDLSASESQIESAVLSFKSKGITHVIICDDNGVSTLFFMTDAAQQGYHPRYGINTGNNMYVVSTAVSKTQLTGAVGIGWSPMLDLGSNEHEKYASSSRTSCNALMKANDESGSQYNELFANTYCSTMDFAQQAYSGLRSLTTQSVLAAMEHIGSSFVPSVTPADYLSPTRHDGLAAIRDYGYSASCSCMAYSGGLIALPH